MKRRVLLGVVAVDSGQLMIIDPCYIEKSWKKEDQATASGILFWGKDKEAMKDLLAANSDVVIADSPWGRAARPGKDSTFEDLRALFVTLKETHNLKIATRVETQSSYSDVCELTLGATRGGELNFAQGNPGLAVAFSSGYGDGLYEVYATYTTEGNGEIISKIEIILA